MPTKEELIYQQLSTIIDPDLQKDIVTLNFIKNFKLTDDYVSFNLQLTTPACPIKEQFKEQCIEKLQKLDFLTKIDISFIDEAKKQDDTNNLANIKYIIAVASCKGGVGKSTTAVNLAYSIAKSKAKVAIFDADLYGPSLPSLVKVDDTNLYQQDKALIPFESNGVKLMSLGFINDPSKAAIMRGPMTMNIIQQLLTGTKWGSLDYLILDLPPGTGDIHLSLAQIAPINAALIVTTPQNLSYVDVVRGIQMFDELKIPTIAVIENMSYIQEENRKNHIFGESSIPKLQQNFGFKLAYQVPIDSKLSLMAKTQVPIVLDEENGILAKIYANIASSTIRESARLKHASYKEPTLTKDNNKLLFSIDNETYEIDNFKLRCQCKCAKCVDEYTNEVILDTKKIPKDITSSNIAKMGNYAFAVHWSDGHTSSIYSFELLKNTGNKVDVS